MLSFQNVGPCVVVLNLIVPTQKIRRTKFESQQLDGADDL